MTFKTANSSEMFILLNFGHVDTDNFKLCVLNMIVYVVGKDFEIKMCFNQTITVFLSEEVTS